MGAFLLRNLLPIACFSAVVTVVIVLCGYWVLLTVVVLVLTISLLFKVFRTLSIIVLLTILIFAWRTFTQVEKLRLVSTATVQETTVSFIVEEVEVKGYKQRIVGRIDEVGETIMVRLPKYPTYAPGQLLIVNCQLSPIEAFDGFAYDRYLASKDIYRQCDFAKVQSVEDRKDRLGYLHRFRLIILARIYELWPKPVNALMAGLLLGTRESFPESTLDAFSRSGITHIIALSGFNITILIAFSEKALVRFYIAKHRRLYFIIFLIALFTIFVGAGASIVRAAIMGSLVFYGKYLARPILPLRILLLTAAVMVFHNPWILLYDVGFQLSFISTLGLLYLTPMMERLFSWVPTTLCLRESLTTTLAATIATLPLILHNFGQLSVISPIANILILPIIPWMMLLGLLAVITSMIGLSHPLVFISSLGGHYLLDIADWCANRSWASMPFTLSFTQMVIAYLLMIIVILFYEQKNRFAHS